jgi:hypothetical protein
MNTRFDPFTSDLVEKYFQRSLFYGIYPSMFSHNASSDPYWKNPKWYNRDRYLFRKYIPLVRRVAEAGWEPVTHAVTDTPHVWLERFGPDEEGAVYLTVLNDSPETLAAAIRVETEALGIDRAESVKDLVTGETIEGQPSGARLELTAPLEPEQVRVLLLPGTR